MLSPVGLLVDRLDGGVGRSPRMFRSVGVSFRDFDDAALMRSVLSSWWSLSWFVVVSRSSSVSLDAEANRTVRVLELVLEVMVVGFVSFLLPQPKMMVRFDLSDSRSHFFCSTGSKASHTSFFKDGLR